MKNIKGIDSNFEDTRKRTWNKYIKSKESYSAILESIDDISTYYPTTGIKLRNMVENHIESPSFKLDATINTSFDMYLKLLSTFEVAFELEYKALEKLFTYICFKHSIITGIKMKRKLAKMHINGKSILKSEFANDLEKKVKELYKEETNND